MEALKLLIVNKLLINISINTISEDIVCVLKSRMNPLHDLTNDYLNLTHSISINAPLN